MSAAASSSPSTKERPILFSGGMVRAILEGRKTQTRRVVRIQPQFDRAGVTSACWAQDALGAWCFPNAAPEVRQICPYGAPGDRLWVRETWAYGCSEDSSEKVAVYRADMNPEDEVPSDVARGLRAAFRYNRWRPSIHMPRWASRISLEITNVRVERVQQITNEDAQAEGCDFRSSKTPNHANAFAILWDSINAKRGFGWDANPWLWVIEFRRLA